MPKHQSTFKVWVRKVKKSLSLLGEFIRKHSISSLSILAWLILSIWWYIVINNSLHKTQFVIQTVDIVGDEYFKLYKHKLPIYLKKDFEGMSKIVLPWYQIKFWNYYRTYHSRIQTIQFKNKWTHLTISIISKKPKLVLNITDWEVATLLENIPQPILMNALPVLSSGDHIPIVQLIINQKNFYDSGYKSIFRDLSAKTLIHQVTLIDENIQWYSNLSWAPWSHKLSVTRTDGKVFFFDLTKNMIEQLNIYKKIALWSWNILSHYQTIDIGTMDKMIFMR